MNNIYNKLYVQNKNSLIHYINHVSSFDLLFDQISSDKIVRTSNYNLLEYFSIASVVLNDYESVVSPIAEQLYYNIPEIQNPILFIHSDMSYMKREDIFLIKSRINQFKVINFHTNNTALFDTTIPLAVPKTKIKHKNNNRILFIGNQKNYNLISDLIQKKGVDSLIDFNVYPDYNSLLEHISNFKTVIYTNIVDRIVASSVGCQTISLKYILEDKDIDLNKISSDMKINYDFDTFSKKIRKVIHI